MDRPQAFLALRVHEIAATPGLTGICVGYERNKWRVEQFASHSMEWLPEFALSSAECEDIGSATAVRHLRAAAMRVYATEKFERRGEFGELFLHIAIRQAFHSLPAVSKLYYKSALNDTVKGFDAVHVVERGESLELWLGEAKFYADIYKAIVDVCSELERHTETDYLRTEFALIVNKIDPQWQHAGTLRRLLDPKVSLDDVFQRVCIPILLTYDSACVAAHTATTAEYAEAFELEIRTHHQALVQRGLPQGIQFHLFLLPLESKSDLADHLDGKLKHFQKI